MQKSRERHGERYVKEERSTVQSCHRPRPRAADVTKAACDCQEAWIMIALHGGYKANIKAVHIAEHDFKGCGGRGGAVGAWTAPVSPLLTAGTGNGQQSKLEHPSVTPASEPHLFHFQGLSENFSSFFRSLFVRCSEVYVGSEWKSQSAGAVLKSQPKRC